MAKKVRLKDPRYPGARIPPEIGDTILEGMLYGFNAYQLAELTDIHWRNVLARITETAFRLNNSTVFLNRLLGEQAYGTLIRQNKTAAPWIETYVERSNGFLDDLAYCLFECPSKTDTTAARLVLFERSSAYRPVQPYSRFVIQAIAEDQNETDRLWFEENPDAYFDRVFNRSMVKLNCRKCRVCTACGVPSNGEEWHNAVVAEVVSFQGYLSDYRRTAKARMQEYFLAYMLAYFVHNLYPIFVQAIVSNEDAMFGQTATRDLQLDNPEGLFEAYKDVLADIKAGIDEHLVMQIETGIVDDVKRPDAFKSRMIALRKRWEWLRTEEGKASVRERVRQAKSRQSDV